MSGEDHLASSGLRDELVEIGGLDRSEIIHEARLVEDLGLDSLALAELLFWAVSQHHLEELANDLETRNWEGVTVREILDLIPPATNR